MVRRLGIVSDKEEYQNIQNRTWTTPIYLEKYIKEIFLIMGKTQTVKALGDIKVDITRDSFRYHWRIPGKIQLPPF